MKSKKGFTLIELLAIIVILAIIAVITVPIILNIIEDSQKGAAKDSAYGFKDSINKYYVSELAKDPHFHLEDGTYTVSELNGSAVLTGTDTYTISLSGTVPTSGTITIENNDIVGGNVQIGDYCIDLSNMEVTKGECGDTPTVQATPERCFEYEVKKKITATDVNACATILLNIGMYNEERSETINAICNGETFLGVDLNQLLLMLKNMRNIDLISQYPNIFETKELDEVEIIGYKCGGQVTEIDEEKETVVSYTNGEHMDVVIPNKIAGKNVTSIGIGAFSPINYNNMKISYDRQVLINSITISNSVTSIGESAFHCNQLTSVILSDSVKYINGFAFSYNKLTNITISNGIISIGDNSFENNQLTSVVIPNSVTTMGADVFANNQLTSVIIPNSVTTMGDTVFRGNHNLAINVIGYTSAPSGWSSGWNSDWNWGSYPVNWNYQG